MGVEIFFPDIADIGDRGLKLQANTVVVRAKATEGSTFTDPSYVDFKDQAAGIGAFFEAYHWPWPGNIQAQAEHVLSVVGPDVPVMWDVENIQELVGVNDVVALTNVYRSLGGTANVVYLPHWYWANRLGQPDLTPLRDLGLLLWASDYRTYDSNNWPAGYGNMAPYGWQYTDAFPYAGELVCFNAVRDDLAGYISKVGVKHLVSTPPQPKGDPMLTHWSTVKRGDTGPEVDRAQGLLIANGLSVGSHNGLPDGDFGPTTDASTRQLQERFGIGVDGQFGPHTLSVALYGHDYA